MLAKWAREIFRGKVLDIGCGPGVILSEVDHGSFKVGLDIDREALRFAPSLSPEAFLAAADWTSLPFRDNSFNGLILSGVLCAHLPLEVKQGILSEAIRVLKPGAEVLVFDLNKDHWAAGRSNPLLMDRAGLERLLADYDLEVVETVGWNPLPSLVWFLPLPLKQKIAAKNHRYKYFFVPSQILARIPGLPSLLDRMGRNQALGRQAKSFVVRARYSCPESF